ncbi:MOSC domain-containing protein [Winogradskyella echinorum]|uniref:MOSC domain-containing protein n=1 Tax=Winogradskyella echinorum TaxID=538189 RepID=A0ABR6Y2S4_9FLAO|nr:MOSC domain-containing protein [Winogradskyella echinorum]MBC3847044.1 MOSC domain-containing protein [Winogradskyella echinorum]MBC5751392.1 MOSC domain-containing protein [Winogradskyella echinorum]
MKVISTNIAQPTTFIWQGKNVTTGIYKKPTDVPIFLGKEEVRGDEVSDRRVHGGVFKACYLFSANHYPFWRNLYPNLNWTYGMLGENLTVEDLDEKQLIIGSIYQLGKAKVQITIPREPCFKFAHKFGTEAVLQQFIDHGYSGSYVSVLEQGEVKNGDTFKLITQAKDSISIHQLFELLFAENKNKDHISLMLENESIPQRLKKRLKFFLR